MLLEQLVEKLDFLLSFYLRMRYSLTRYHNYFNSTDPERIQVNPDCGLRTRSWDVVYEKLSNMVQGTRLAEDALS